MLEPNNDRAGAIVIPAKDYEDINTELEQACNLLGSRCTEEIKKNFQTIKENINFLTKGSTK